jgi:hypothetical protein
MKRIEFIAYDEKMALVPPPRYYIVHYHGVLAPAAKWRRNMRSASSDARLFTPIGGGSKTVPQELQLGTNHGANL